MSGKRSACYHHFRCAKVWWWSWWWSWWWWWWWWCWWWWREYIQLSLNTQVLWRESLHFWGSVTAFETQKQNHLNLLTLRQIAKRMFSHALKQFMSMLCYGIVCSTWSVWLYVHAYLFVICYPFMYCWLHVWCMHITDDHGNPLLLITAITGQSHNHQVWRYSIKLHIWAWLHLLQAIVISVMAVYQNTYNLMNLSTDHYMVYFDCYCNFIMSAVSLG